jgi:hypothetical protein
MALTPDPRSATLERLNMLRTNRTIVVHALKRMVSNSTTNAENNDSSSEDDSRLGNVDTTNAKIGTLHACVSSTRHEVTDIEADDGEEERKAQQQLKELESEVNRVLARKKVDKHPATLSEKNSQSEGHLCEVSLLYKSTNVSGLATPPKPRRATSSRTNSLESNGAGVAPGSPFQNNPLLVSHDYSKSPMLIDEENEDETAEDKDNKDEMQCLHDDISVDEKSSNTSENRNNIKAEDIKFDNAQSNKILERNAESPIKNEAFVKNTPCTQININSSYENLKSQTDPKETDIKSESTTNDVPSFDPKLARLNSPQRFSPSSLLSLLRNIEVDISDCRSILKEANERRRRHAIDDCRRSHDYDQFITAFLSMLAERGHLGDLLEHGISVAKKKYQNSNGNNSAGANSADGSEGSSDNESISKAKKIKAKKALMKKKNKAKGVTHNSATENKQKSKGRGRPKKNK